MTSNGFHLTIEFIVYFEKKRVFKERLKLIRFVCGFAESFRKSTISTTILSIQLKTFNMKIHISSLINFVF